MRSLAPSPLAVLGAGYIGGSVALAARRAGLASRVCAYDPDPGAGPVLRARGIADEVVPDPARAVRGARVVVLAAPVGALEGLARSIAGDLAPDALVMDVGSVKAPVVEAVRRAAPAARFVGCHPLAGTEASGAAAADPEIFGGRTCFVCPATGTAADALGEAQAFWRGLGSIVVEIDADAHDALMAAVSHLPHAAAFALAAALAGWREPGQGGPAPLTTSLRDTTRIAASSPAVWRDIFLANRRHLLSLVEGFESRVAELRAALEAGDGAALEALLARGRQARATLEARSRQG